MQDTTTMSQKDDNQSSLKNVDDQLLDKRIQQTMVKLKEGKIMSMDEYEGENPYCYKAKK